MFDKGHSLAELVIVVLVVAVLACVAVPRLQFATVHGVEADVVVRKLATDLRRARAAAILNAAENPEGYAVVMSGSADGYAGYEVVNLQDSDVLTVYDIPANVCCSGGRRFEFGPLGGLKEGSDTQLQVSSGNRASAITVVPATGMVKCL
jgi:Tfp pilus assembly protein FimT